MEDEKLKKLEAKKIGENPLIDHDENDVKDRYCGV